jgi:tRNA (guanine-N7-)-methyltransferase
LTAPGEPAPPANGGLHAPLPARSAASAASAHPTVPAASTACAAPADRHIRSFVMRRGHLSDAQRDAHQRLLPRYAVPDARGPIDFTGLFGRTAPVVLEIGFGMGLTTAEIAAVRPDTDFLGVEVYTPGVGSLLRQIELRGLTNVRVIQQDAVEVLRDRIAPGSLAGIHVYFPDPWPKKRHHKRRLIQPAFVGSLADRLAPGGYLHCATDWEEYAGQMLAVLSAEPRLANTADGFAPRPDWRPPTRFEQRGLRLGHGVRDLMFVRRPPEESLP